jgi:two-component system OmpR family response regulator
MGESLIPMMGAQRSSGPTMNVMTTYNSASFPGQFSVLVAADDPLALKALSRQLDASGYRVRTAASSADVYLSINAEVPDLVVLDPGPTLASGDLYRRLRCGHQTRDLPILLVAAPTATERYASPPEASWFLAKPITLAALSVRVEALLRNLAG